MNESLYKFLADHCLSGSPRRYLEIGTREGDSLRIVVQSSDSLERIVCADMWGTLYGGTGRGSHEHIERMLQLQLYVGDVRFLDGDSRQTIPTLAEEFDLVLVDGDHSEEGGAADLANTWPLVARGGCLVFHDITHPEHRYLLGVWERFVDEHAGEIAHHGIITEGYGLGFCHRS